MRKTMIASLLAVCLLATASTCRRSDLPEGCGCEGPGKEIKDAEAVVIKTSPYFAIDLPGLYRPVDPEGSWMRQLCDDGNSLPAPMRQIGARFRVSGLLKENCPNVRAPGSLLLVTEIEPITDSGR